MQPQNLSGFISSLHYLNIFVIYLYYLHIKGDPKILPNIVIILSMVPRITEKSLFDVLQLAMAEGEKILWRATRWQLSAHSTHGPYHFHSQLIGQK